MSWKIYFIFAVVFAADDYTRVTTRKNEASEGLDQLGWHFVRSAPANENMVCSPFSVAGVLHMLAAGSQGETRTQILKYGLGLEYEKYVSRRGVFKYKLLVDSYKAFTDAILGSRADKYECKVFNGLYHQQDDEFTTAGQRQTNPEYARVINKGWIRDMGEIKELDFQRDATAAREYINSQVESNTNGKIKDIIKTIDDSTLAVVLSAIYFESQWKLPVGYNKGKVFEDVPEGDVQSDPKFKFYKSIEYIVENELQPENDKEIKWIRTTSGEVDSVKVYEDEDVFVIRLELEGRSRSSSVFLNIFQPHYFMDQIKDWTWENFTEVLDRAERDGKPLGGVLRMPSFSIDYEKNLNGWMDALGVRKMFIPGEADLSPMLPNRKDEAFVRYIKHQATFDLDATGVVASAATVAVIADKSHNMESIREHYVNCPFYFSLTVTEKNIPLFMGKVVDPRKKPV